MGRHTRGRPAPGTSGGDHEQPRPDVATPVGGVQNLPGWGLFATGLATLFVGLGDAGWAPALALAALGSGCTGVLHWVSRRGADRPPNAHRHRAGRRGTPGPQVTMPSRLRPLLVSPTETLPAARRVTS
jgi:hypothetical protein